MSRTGLASDGRTESLEVYIGGSPVNLSVHLTSISWSPTLAVRDRMPSGTVGVILTPDAQGGTLSWTGADVTPDFALAIAAYMRSVEAKAPLDVSAIRQVFYPSNGQRVLETYADGTFESFPRSGGAVGQDSTYSVSVRFGRQPDTETLT